MDNIWLSIIIPVYNREEKIPAFLDSILSASFDVLRNIEIIIVDDDSADESYSVCEAFAQKHDIVSCIRLDANQGPGAARNRGMDAARGNFLFFLDSDDLIATENLGKTIQLLKNCPDTDIFLFHATLEGAGSPRVRKHSSAAAVEGFIPFEEFISGAPAIPMTWQCVIKREFLITNNLRFIHIYYCEDTPFTASSLFYANILYLASYTLCRHMLGVADSLIFNAFSNKKRLFDDYACALSAFERLYRASNDSGWHNTLLIQLYEVLFFLIGALSPSELQELISERNSIQKADFSELSYNIYSQLGLKRMISTLLISILDKIDVLCDGGNRAFFLCPACPRSIMFSETLSQAGVGIDGFLDNSPRDDNPAARLCRDNGYQVLRPEDILAEKPVVFIISNSNVVRELRAQFSAMGFLEGKDFISSLSSVL